MRLAKFSRRGRWSRVLPCHSNITFEKVGSAHDDGGLRRSPTTPECPAHSISAAPLSSCLSCPNPRPLGSTSPKRPLRLARPPPPYSRSSFQAPTLVEQISENTSRQMQDGKRDRGQLAASPKVGSESP